MKTAAIFLLTLAFFTTSIAVAADIPYIEQDRKHKPKGMCGAGSLDMVYASFGKPQDQHEIFEFIAIPQEMYGRKGSAASTYKMSRDAIRRGFYALAILIKDPLAFFKNFTVIKESVRVIFIHKSAPGSKSSHCTVFLDVTDEDIIIHDPAGKPNRHVPKEQFLKMWSEKSNTLIAISDKKTGYNNCAVCGKAIPDKISCPACPKMVGLEPKNALGCIDNSCPNRMWKYILCPYCGHSINGISGTEGLSSKIKKSNPKKEKNTTMPSHKQKS